MQPALSRRPTGSRRSTCSGLALLGILAMNIRAMAAPFGAYMYPYALFDYLSNPAGIKPVRSRARGGKEMIIAP